MSNSKGLSISSSSATYRKVFWAILVISAVLLLAVLVTIDFIEENTTEKRSTTDTVTCNRYAAVDGFDNAEGTESAPFKTVQRLVDSLRPGQVGCLRKGVYTNSDEQVVFEDSGKKGSRIVLRSYPGERAVFRGSIYIPDGTDYITVRDMRLDASYGPVGPGHFKNNRNTAQSIEAMGDNVNILYSNITNRRPNGNPDLAGTCIFLGSTPVNTTITGNRIHHCGQIPRINREHGIYASHSRGAKIRDNLIYANADRGIQLYPDAQKTLIEDNLIDGNGQNIVFAGSESTVSSDSIVRNNVISNSQAGWNVSGNWNQTQKVGKNNVVYDNCVWASDKEPNGGISPEEQGFDTHDNLIARPEYVAPNAGNFKLGDRSPCKTIVDKKSGYSKG